MVRIAKNAINAKGAGNAKIAKNARKAKTAKIAEIAETEIVRLLKTFEIWVFLKNRWAFQKNLIFFNFAKVGKITVECVSNGIISEK